MRLAILSAVAFAFTFWLTGGCATEDFEPDTFFCAAESSESLPVRGKDCESAQRVASAVDRVLGRAKPRVAAGLQDQGVSLFVIDNEEELERNPALLEFLLDSRPVELIYTDIEGVDETMPEHQGTIAQKLMQLFVYYPLELDAEYDDLQVELEAAFNKAIEPRDEIGGRPLYNPDDYSHPDEAHPHMGPPYYTAIGAYLGLGYEVHFGLTRTNRNETEYYPITGEEMSRLDPDLVTFLDNTMSKADEEMKR